MLGCTSTSPASVSVFRWCDSRFWLRPMAAINSEFARSLNVCRSKMRSRFGSDNALNTCAHCFSCGVIVVVLRRAWSLPARACGGLGQLKLNLLDHPLQVRVLD